MSFSFSTPPKNDPIIISLSIILSPSAKEEVIQHEIFNYYMRSTIEENTIKLECHM